MLTVSVTEATALVHRVERLTELDAAVFRGGRPLAATVNGAAVIELPSAEEAADIEVRGDEYRGRVVIARRGEGTARRARDPAASGPALAAHR